MNLNMKMLLAATLLMAAFCVYTAYHAIQSMKPVAGNQDAEVRFEIWMAYCAKRPDDCRRIRSAVP